MGSDLVCPGDVLPQQVEGVLDATGKRFALVAGRWHGPIVERLIDGAISSLVKYGAEPEAISIVRVPGSFEIPLACKHLALSGNYSALIALGVLIQGETDHYRLIADGLAQGLIAVMLETAVPIGFGVIAADSIHHASERAGDSGSNKGEEAALAALEMVGLLRDRLLSKQVRSEAGFK